MQSRDLQLKQLLETDLDVLIIGGGINGASVATAISSSEYRVALVDKTDFSSQSSQNSSGLIWGGIKYLQSGKVFLVRQLSRQRNALMRAYPSQISETRFLLLFDKENWIKRRFVYFGTWFYWLLGGGRTDRPRLMKKEEIRQLEPALAKKNGFTGVEYSDATLVDGDARFVFNLIDKATRNGSLAINYLTVTGLNFNRHEGGSAWCVSLFDEINQKKITINTRVVVNAAGPFADNINQLAGVDTKYRHVFSKGVHLVVKRFADSGRVLSFFSSDGRPFFVIPTGGESSIGTTDTKVCNQDTHVDEMDREFILANLNKVLAKPFQLSLTDIISERSGVRPLAVSRKNEELKNFFHLSRRHLIESSKDFPIITIFGGKLTSCLEVGTDVRREISSFLDSPHMLFQNHWLGEPDAKTMSEFLDLAGSMMNHKNLPDALFKRLWRYYGEDAYNILTKINSEPDGSAIILKEFDITRAELDFIRENQMVMKLEDFIRRRTLFALTFNKQELSDLPGMWQACEILFGDLAGSRYDEYFG